MNTHPTTDMAGRLSKLEGVVEGLAIQFEGFIKHQDTRDAAQAERDKALFRKLDEAKDLSRPNMINMAAWAGVVVVVIFGIWTPVANGFSERINTVSSNLTRENQLSIAGAVEKAEQLKEEVKHLQQWQDDQIRLDAEELRARRQHDAGIH